jgi:histidinol-phosphate aminotransferase
MSASKAPTPRPGILDIAAYQGGEGRIPGLAKPIRLASNESALGPSPAAVAAYKAAADDMFRYPDGHAAALRQTLARHFGIDADRIVCGAGSDDLIHLLASAYAGPGDEVLYGKHGFAIYPIAAQTAGATPVPVPEKNLTFDVDATLARVTKKTRIVFIANPNNPTGTFIPRDALARLHKGLPRSVLLVVDSAYAEYVVRNDYDPGLALATDAPNVVMTRTFSKIYALGGLRLGWCTASTAIVDVLNRVRNPFNVSSAAIAAGIAALEDVASVDKARAHNDVWRPFLARELAALGLEIVPSVANFVLARFPAAPKDASAAWDFLRGRGILVRKVGVYHLPEYLRITIGTEAEMREVVAAVSAFLGKS